MRWISGSFLLCVSSLFLFFSSPAEADGLPVGVISFDQLVVGNSGSLFGLDVFNATQPGGGSPVTTSLTFSDLILTVLLSSGASENVPLNSVDAFGDFSTGALFSAGDISSTTLTGTFSSTSVTLADGSTANIEASFATVLTDPAAGSLQGGDFAVINANTVVQGAPEPGTLPLLVLALIGFAQWRWMRWRGRARVRLRSAGAH